MVVVGDEVCSFQIVALNRRGNCGAEDGGILYYRENIGYRTT